jgi:hypothetical protein
MVTLVVDRAEWLEPEARPVETSGNIEVLGDERFGHGW